MPLYLTSAPIKTSVFQKGDNLESFLVKHLGDELQKDSLEKKTLEGKVLAITSKIVSLAENRVVTKKELAKRSETKSDLVKKEAEYYLGQGGYGTELTIKHGILIPSSGIDESNSPEGDYILFPRSPFKSAEAIWDYLRRSFNLKNFGVVITDSHTTPLRRGVTGVALSFWGFKPTRNLVGQEDLFGRGLQFTHMNVADALATSAVLVMGESNECTPLAVLSYSNVEFCDGERKGDIAIEPHNDIYYPILKEHLPKK